MPDCHLHTAKYNVVSLIDGIVSRDLPVCAILIDMKLKYIDNLGINNIRRNHVLFQILEFRQTAIDRAKSTALVQDCWHSKR